MDALFDGLTVTDFHGNMHRNIVSLRESQDLFDDLSDSPKSRQVAINLELSTKAHTHISNQPIIDRPFEEAAYNDAIEYPFSHWSRTRYSRGSYATWYGADTLETSVHETVYHWRHELLKDAGWQDVEGVSIERKVFLVRCDAALLNFLPKLDEFPALVDPDSYHFTHEVGARIHHDGHPGLISRSARCEGDVYAIFNSWVLSSPRQFCYLTYRLEEGFVTVERQPGERLLRI